LWGVTLFPELVTAARGWTGWSRFTQRNGMATPGKTTVVHVAGQLEYGGLEKFLVELGRHADRDRFNLHFVSLAGRGPIAAELEALGWPVSALDIGPGVLARVVLRLAQMFQRMAPSVVHTHNTRPLVYAGPAARLARVPWVVHSRHGQAFGKGRRDRWLRRVGSQLVNRVVCVSHDGRRIASAEGIPANRLRTVWNGIDPTRFASAAPAGNGPVVTVGRLSPEKDYATLIRAAALVVKEAPDFRLFLGGGGACEQELRDLVASLGLTSVVHLLGPVSDVQGLMASGSLFVLSSLTEGVSLTILEAMAAGLPVVATAVGGNPEVVVDGLTGLLVPAADPPRLAAALLELWRDAARRAELGAAGRQRVCDQFDIRRTVAQYERIYDRKDVGPGTEVIRC
jgi:glycosyltransferase involved in cell wall biosynthesis